MDRRPLHDDTHCILGRDRGRTQGKDTAKDRKRMTEGSHDKLPPDGIGRQLSGNGQPPVARRERGRNSRHNLFPQTVESRPGCAGKMPSVRENPLSGSLAGVLQIDADSIAYPRTLRRIRLFSSTIASACIIRAALTLGRPCSLATSSHRCLT